MEKTNIFFFYSIERSISTWDLSFFRDLSENMRKMFRKRDLKPEVGQVKVSSLKRDCLFLHFTFVSLKSFETERGSSSALTANSVKDKGRSQDLKSGASCSAEVIVEQCIDVMFILSEHRRPKLVSREKAND